MKRVRHYLEYHVLIGIGYLIRDLPRPKILRLGRYVGDFIYYCVPVRKAIVLDHLEQAFPEKSVSEIKKIARGTYQNLGMNVLEHLCIPTLSDEEIRCIVDLADEEILVQALERNRGVIIVGGHFGNWEYLGASINAYGFPTSFLVKTQSNPWVDRVQNGIRASGGMGVIRQNQVRRLMEVLRKGEYIGILPDQNAGGEGIFIDFMGRKASASRGLAFLAWKYNCPIVPAVAVRKPDGTHLAVFKPAIWPRPEWDEETAVRELTQAFASILEEFIREYPDHYFWVHRRWKTRPPQEKES